MNPSNIRNILNTLQQINESELISDPKLREIEQDIRGHEVPPTVISKMIALMKNLIRVDDNSAAEPELEEPELEEAVDPDTNKWTIGAKDQLVFDLLKRTNPENADKVWAFYNKAMLEEYLVPMLNEKDINKHDDHMRVVNLFVSAPGALEDKIALANKLAAGGGVINTKKLTTAGAGSIDSLINYKNPVLDSIKHALITFKVSPSTTAVNTGDGEAFFLILGNGVSKLGAGDLNVLGKEVEVKAQGARLKGFGGKGVYGDGSAYYKTFNLDLMKIIGPKGADELDEQIGFDAKQPFNFGIANLAALSDVLSRYGKGQVKAVKVMFNDALAFIFKQSTPAMRKRVTDTIDSKGSFDVQEFRKAWFLLTYDYYMETSKNAAGIGFDGILFIHQPSFTYKYVKDANQIESDWDKFELNSGLYTWTDVPSVAPKITFGKEVRQKRVKPSTPKATPDQIVNAKVSIRPPGTPKADSVERKPSALRARR